jgi:hypothetical protein
MASATATQAALSPLTLRTESPFAMRHSPSPSPSTMSTSTLSPLTKAGAQSPAPRKRAMSMLSTHSVSQNRLSKIEEDETKYVHHRRGTLEFWGVASAQD